MARNDKTMTEEAPGIDYKPAIEDGVHGDGVSDAQMNQGTPVFDFTSGYQAKPFAMNYKSGSVLDLAYGANDPSQVAAQMVQSGELFRIQRGWPYYRVGQLVKAQPQFKAGKIYCQDTGSKVSTAYYTDAQNGIIKYPTKVV